MKYWLFKSEPDVFSIEDLKNSKMESEVGRSSKLPGEELFADEVKKGDLVLFYHSRIEPMAVIRNCRGCERRVY